MLLDGSFHCWFISIVVDVKALGPVGVEDRKLPTHLDVLVLDQRVFLPADFVREGHIGVEQCLHVITNHVVGRIVYLRTGSDVEPVFTLSDLFHEARDSTRVQHTPALTQCIASGPAFSSSLEGSLAGAQYHLLEQRCSEPQAKGQSDVSVLAGLVESILNPLVRDDIEFVVLGLNELSQLLRKSTVVHQGDVRPLIGQSER